jgi:cell wall-associated NlpC family hydrolase
MTRREFKRLTWALALAPALAGLAACTVSPRYTQQPVQRTEVSPGDETRTLEGNAVVEEAQRYLGTPYRNGGTTKNGMDCSGLTWTVFKTFGVALPRTSRAQSLFGAEVDRATLRPGDLVFFRTNGSSTVSHVGIYAGDGSFIHASTQHRRVKFDRLDNKYFKRRFVTARRVL